MADLDLSSCRNRSRRRWQPQWQSKSTELLVLIFVVALAVSLEAVGLRYGPAYATTLRAREDFVHVRSGQHTLWTSSSRSVAQPRTAGIVVVGDEVLNGKVNDVNAHYLCGELRGRGVAVTCIEVVPDDVERIAGSVQRISRACDFVFTSGGIGPTHDDKTMEGVAAAFGTRLVVDARFRQMLVARASAKQGTGCNGTCEAGLEVARNKLASVPESCLVEWPSDGNPWPLVSMHNVYIFAGMPAIFRAMFQRAASDGRFDCAHSWASCVLELDAEEETILEALQATVDAFPRVSIGSYPSRDLADAMAARTSSAGAAESWQRRLSISLEAFDEDQLLAARNHLVSALPAHTLPPSNAYR